MAKKISSNDLFDANLFTKTKDDALLYLSVLKDIEKEYKDLLTVQGQLVKTSNKNDVAGLKQRESAIKKITIAEKELLQVEMAIEKTEAKLNLSSSEQVRKLAELRDSLNRKNKAQRDSIKIALEDSDAYKRLSRSVNEAQANFKRLSAQFGINSKQAKQAQIALDGVQKELLQIDAAARDGKRTVGRYGTAFSGLGNGIKGIGARFLAVTALIYGVGRAMVSSFKIFRDFQQGAANLAAVLGKSRSEITKLTDDAKRLGASTAFTASEVTRMQVAFSKLGFNEDEIIAATEATLALAAATGTELEEAAEVSAATLNGFGLEASETQRVVDVMAKSFSTSALDMEKFKVAMRAVGPVAKTAGFSIERTTAMIGVLADNGVRAETAGTGLRNVFLELSKRGITFEQAMSKIANSSDKAATSMELFGKENAVVGVVLSKNNEKLVDMEKGLQNAGGAAQEMAETQLDTLSGATTRLSSAWEGFILSLEDGDGVIGRVLKGAIDLTTEFINTITNLTMSTAQFEKTKANNFKSSGTSAANQNIKESIDLMQKSDRALEGMAESQDKNASKAALILKMREDGLSLLEQEVVLNAKNAVWGKDVLNIFEGISKEREGYLSEELKAQLKIFGVQAETLDAEELKKKLQAEGIEKESKNLAILRLKKSTNSELISLIEKENVLRSTEYGVLAVQLAKDELQRRKDIGEQIDENAENDSKSNSKKEKSAFKLAKAKDNEIEKQDLLLELINERTELEKKLQDELKISGGFETATTEKIREQLKLKNELIIGRQVPRANQSAAGGDVVRIEKTNDELLADYEKYLDGKQKAEEEDAKKAEDAKKKEDDLFNQRLKAAQDFANKLVEISNKRIDKQLEGIDKEIEASKARQQQLEEIANQGQLTAQQSLKSEVRKQAELEKQKAELEQRKQRREALASGFNLLAANLEKGDSGNDAVTNTFRQMTTLISLISNLPGFYKGTDNAPGGLAWTDEKGAEIHLDKDGNIKDFGSNAGPQLKYLTKGDKILTAGESNIVKRQLNMQPALEAKERKSAVAMNDARIVQAVQSVVQAVNDKPVQEFDYDKIQQAVIDSIKGNGEINRKHISNKPKF